MLRVMTLALIGALNTSASAAELLTQRFTTAGHPKADGLTITLRYPETWEAEEGERPHVVQKFVARGGGVENCNILIRRLPAALARAQIKQFVASSDVDTMIGPGLKLQKKVLTTVDGLPAAALLGSGNYSSGGMTASVVTVVYVTVYKNHLISLTCGYLRAGPAEHAQQTSTFALIANSIVVQDQWAH